MNFTNQIPDTITVAVDAHIYVQPNEPFTREQHYRLFIRFMNMGISEQRIQHVAYGGGNSRFQGIPWPVMLGPGKAQLCFSALHLLLQKSFTINPLRRLMPRAMCLQALPLMARFCDEEGIAVG